MLENLTSKNLLLKITVNFYKNFGKMILFELYELLITIDNVYRYFDEFLSDTFTSPLFTDPGKKSDAADIIHKLHLIAQELPYNRFSAVCNFDLFYSVIYACFF